MLSIATLGQIASVTSGYLQTPNGLNNLAIKIPRHVLQLIMASGRSLSQESRELHDTLTLVKNILTLSELVENFERACKRSYELVAGTEETESTGKRSLGTKFWDVFSAYVSVAGSAIEVLEAARTLKLVYVDKKAEAMIAYVEASAALISGVEWLAKDWVKDRSSDTPENKAGRSPLVAGFSALAVIGSLSLLSLMYKDRMKVSPWTFPGLSAAITASFIASHYRASFQAGKS